MLWQGKTKANHFHFCKKILKQTKGEPTFQMNIFGFALQVYSEGALMCLLQVFYVTMPLARLRKERSTAVEFR